MSEDSAEQTTQGKAVVSRCRTGNDCFVVYLSAHAKGALIDRYFRASPPEVVVITDQLLSPHRTL